MSAATKTKRRKNATTTASAIDVVLDGGRWNTTVRGARAWCRTAAKAAIKAAGHSVRGAELCIALSTNRRVRALNRIFRGIDKPTNVLSFAVDGGSAPHDTSSRHLGDIVIAFETTRREAARENKTVRAHLAHLVVHGVLHLLGHDHIAEDDAARMEDLERKTMAGLGLRDPYAWAAAPKRSRRR